ncbi:hypothetical protein HOY80DRAFT_1141526 [Tuber brumale]|nr:hypothetical protein HOY80DRAFT_1141526 [Tuber brumale]
MLSPPTEVHRLVSVGDSITKVCSPPEDDLRIQCCNKPVTVIKERLCIDGGVHIAHGRLLFHDLSNGGKKIPPLVNNLAKLLNVLSAVRGQLHSHGGASPGLRDKRPDEIWALTMPAFLYGSSGGCMNLQRFIMASAAMSLGEVKIPPQEEHPGITTMFVMRPQPGVLMIFTRVRKIRKARNGVFVGGVHRPTTPQKNTIDILGGRQEPWKVVV